MTYATYDDLVTRFGEMKLTQLTDRATPPARCPDKAVIGAALTDATEAIEGYAAGRYRTPLDPVPAPVRLKDMARGVIIFQAEGVPTANTDASGGVRLDVPSRIFSPDSLKGF